MIDMIFVYPSGIHQLLLVISIAVTVLPAVSLINKKNISAGFNLMHSSITRKYLKYPGAVLFSICLFLLEEAVGNRQFDGFDLSGIVDVGWRQIMGQKLFSDFICVLPVGFMLPVKYAYQIFGIAWNSITIINSSFLIITFWWMYFLFKNLKISAFQSFLLSLMTEMASVFMISYWWYNSITTVLCIIFILSALSLLASKPRWQISISYIISLSFLALSKPNIAMIIIFFVTIILITQKKSFMRIVLFSLSAVVIDVIILYSNGLNPFIVCRGYLDGVERALPTKFFAGFSFPEKVAQVFEFFFLSICCFLIIIKKNESSNFNQRKLFTQRNLILGIIILAGFYQWGTSREIAAVSFPLIFIPLFLAAGDYLSNSIDIIPLFKNIYYSSILFLIIIGLVFGMLRYRIELVGPFFEATSQKTENSLYFNHCYESPSFNETLSEISAAIKNDSKSKVFFGPRLEFAYCAFKRPSPLNMPLYWFKGSSYKSSKEPEIISNWKKKSFNLVIIRRNDFMRIPQEIISYIENNYDKKEEKQITIYTKKKN
jgi:hypothetical protein